MTGCRQATRTEGIVTPRMMPSPWEGVPGFLEAAKRNYPARTVDSQGCGSGHARTAGGDPDDGFRWLIE